MLWIAVHGLQRWAFRRGPQARLAARMEQEQERAEAVGVPRWAQGSAP